MTSQTDLRQALLDPALPVPTGLGDGHDGPAGRRFSVYRNNVVVSLKDAMATAFPLVNKLIGAENFANVCGRFVRDHPPSSPVMMHYGAEFPDFLKAFEPLQKWGYLPDCARLDLAMRQSYHAADSTPVAPDVFADESALQSLTLGRSPSSLVIRSNWPLYDLWQYNMVAGSPAPQASPQDVLIARPSFDPVPHLLPLGGATWLAHLQSNLSFTAATEETFTSFPDFDLAQMLTLALQTNTLIQDH
ncbi:MAG: putative DNA-binding domain-containing protein [Roseobacter sp.]